MGEKVVASSCKRLANISLSDPVVDEAFCRRIQEGTAQVYANAPLSGSSPAERGDRIESLVRSIDERYLHVGANFSKPASADFDWLRGRCKVECKSSKFSWNCAR